MPELFHYFVVGATVTAAVIIMIASFLAAGSPTRYRKSGGVEDKPWYDHRHWPKVVWACRVIWIVVAITFLGAMVVGRG